MPVWCKCQRDGCYGYTDVTHALADSGPTTNRPLRQNSLLEPPEATVLMLEEAGTASENLLSAGAHACNSLELRTLHRDAGNRRLKDLLISTSMARDVR